MFEAHFLIHTSQAEKTGEAGRGRVFTVSIEQGAGSQLEDHWDLGKCTNKGIMRLPSLAGRARELTTLRRHQA